MGLVDRLEANCISAFSNKILRDLIAEAVSHIKVLEVRLKEAGSTCAILSNANCDCTLCKQDEAINKLRNANKAAVRLYETMYMIYGDSLMLAGIYGPDFDTPTNEELFKEGQRFLELQKDVDNV